MYQSWFYVGRAIAPVRRSMLRRIILFQSEVQLEAGPGRLEDILVAFIPVLAYRYHFQSGPEVHWQISNGATYFTGKFTGKESSCFQVQA